MNVRLPKGVYYLNLIQIFATTGIGVLLGTLNAYLQQVGYSTLAANGITSSVLALNFVLHFLGGVIGGRWISYRQLFAYSLTLQAVGLLGLALPHWLSPLWALAIFITGSGFNVSCLTIMLTQLFAAEDDGRRRAFSQNYACMNIGFLITFVIANKLQLHQSYLLLFALAFFSLLVALAIHLSAYRLLIGNPLKRPRPFIVVGSLMVIVVLISQLLAHPHLAHTLVYLGFIASLITVWRIAKCHEGKARGQCYAYIVLISAAFVYALILGLSGTAVANFVLYNTQGHFLGLPLSTAGVNLFDPLAVVLFGFWLNRTLQKREAKGLTPWSAPRFIASAMSLNILAFLMLPLGILLQGSHGYVSLGFPILFFIIAAGAEIGVNSVCYALAGQLVPPRYQGIFMGYLFMNVALGVSLAGPLANIMAAGAHQPLLTDGHYAKVFVALAVFAAGATLFYAKVSPWFQRMQDGIS